jgi:aspartate aminotransferase
MGGDLNKEYLPIRGDDGFTRACGELLYGADSVVFKEKRIASVQSISGTGALRLAADFLSKWGGKPKVYISTPTWSNHKTIFGAAGLEVASYDYYSPSLLGVDMDAMLASLSGAAKGSVVVLHMCCHNPTGADFTEDQWRRLADVMEEKGLIPLFDCAYQGFATGLVDEDAFPIRHFVSKGFEVFSAQSFSKNLGLYNERAGAVSLITKTTSAAVAAKSQFEIIIRHAFSNPPSHGAWIAAHVLTKQNKEWRDELYQVTQRIIKMRELLQAEILRLKTPGSWSHITQQRGMFCFSGLSALQSKRMISEHHIYMLENGRINCAALREGDIGYLAACIKDVITTNPTASSNL